MKKKGPADGAGSFFLKVLLHLLWKGDITLYTAFVESSVCWSQVLTHPSPNETSIAYN